MHAFVQERLPEVFDLCRQYRVRRLELFGSATGERFDPARSDLDFLVEYFPEPERDPLDEFFGFKSALEQVFGRKVDLVEPAGIRNRHFRDEVAQTKVPIYAA
ncbi:MAG: nucleotidyltransferase domain-containing protein [Candidatus Lambdaproteobacteria bacterium]|nr:nucleotidyltransferase domain-containing protein [Candidatus Lambdaproteobacteria bacterium]